VLVPCLLKISMNNNYSFRGIQFTGGSNEQGTDIEYYEMIGPDKFRHYTGIQVKKKDLSVSTTRELINQGTRAFEKGIIDLADGRPHRLHRWIVATTGNITDPAKAQIHAELDRYGKPIAFWDGIRVSELILENFYNEFISIMNVPLQMAGLSSGATTMYDPDEQLEIASDFAPTEWSRLDISQMVPPTASGIYIAVKPSGGNLPPVKVAIRSSIDELLVDSFSSQVSPHFIKLEPGETTIQAAFVEGDRPVSILARGYLEFR
jgi:hypothetical protein